VPIIDSNLPGSWQDLQIYVAKILSEIGLSVTVGQTVSTARGEIELDVMAIDETSLEKIRYIIECKNWEANIPQSVIHSFTTVMHETGGNIGFIIARNGFQSGAIEFVKYTNIKLYSYIEFETTYLNVWFQKYFLVQLCASNDSLLQYVEDIGSRRDRRVASLGIAEREMFKILVLQYKSFGMSMCMPGSMLYGKSQMNVPVNCSVFRNKINSKFPGIINLQSDSYRGILTELINVIENITFKFNCLFGRNIFYPELTDYILAKEKDA